MNRHFCVWSSHTHKFSRSVVFASRSAGRVVRLLKFKHLVSYDGGRQEPTKIVSLTILRIVPCALLGMSHVTPVHNTSAEPLRA